jgi:hypothetical protein
VKLRFNFVLCIQYKFCAIRKHIRLKVKVSTFLYSDTYREISDQYHFTSWEVTGKNDAWSRAHCGLRRVSPIAPTSAASLVHAVPVAAQRTLTPRRSWYQFIDPGGMNGLVGRGTCELTPCPRTLQNGPCGRA